MVDFQSVFYFLWFKGPVDGFFKTILFCIFALCLNYWYSFLFYAPKCVKIWQNPMARECKRAVPVVFAQVFAGYLAAVLSRAKRVKGQPNTPQTRVQIPLVRQACSLAMGFCYYYICLPLFCTVEKTKELQTPGTTFLNNCCYTHRTLRITRCSTH